MPNHTKHRGFTVSFNEAVDELITSINVVPILTIDKTFRNIPVEVEALWDTGATATCIKPALFKRLKLQFFDKAGQTVFEAIGGKKTANPTLVNLFLAPLLEIEFCPVYVVNFPGDADVLIGMDIIQMGDFAICNADRKTSFSFAMPPFPNRIDFAKKAEEQ